MRIAKISLLAAALAFGSVFPAFAGTQVLIKTSLGDITLELDDEKAPKTVKNFLKYVDDGFYNNTVFHRVMQDFMVQGGGFALLEDGKIEQKKPNAMVENEAKNGLKNLVGTVAMARTSDPHSASSQFFINHKDNTNLDYPAFDGWGYAVFGKVVKGIDVVDEIAKVETGSKELHARMGDQTMARPMNDVPTENVVIESVTRVAASE
tara:strand:- start:4979 stop:5599 length:621 start_codon:yes stop_codon:yes gene_type:complete